MAKNIVSKKEPTKNRNDKEFSDFFKKHGQDVKKQDMSIIERAPLNIRRNRFLFIFIILILIAVAAWLGFYVFTQENNYTGDNIIVEMDIQDQVASGDEISVDILISNSEAVDLKVSELTVRFPEGFKFSSANPEASNEFNNAWDLGVIQAGTEKRVTVRGQLVGEVDSEKVFLATYSYTPSDFNYEFQETATKEVTISSSTIDLDLEVPDGAIDGQEIQIKVSYQNTSADTLERVRLRMTYPDGFTFLSADPSPRSGGNNVWQDDVLAELEAKEIIINGTISGEVGSMKQVVAEIGIIKADGLFSLQTESYSLLNILEPDSDLQLIVNNNYEDSIIDWGSDLAWQLIFKNNGQIVLNDIALTVTWSQTPADILDLDSLQDDNEGQVTSTSLTWTSEQIEDLAVVRPGDEVIIDWLLATKDYNDLTIEEGDINWQLTSQAVASSDSLTDTGSGFSQESNLIINKIGTTSSFNAEGRYFDDDLDKVGAGPLPPEVGQKTTYKIYWFLSNTTNQLEDVVIKAQIPANAEWEGSSTVSPSGTLDYNKTTREVTWTIKQLETFYGSLLPEARATFLVSITPASSDIGDLLTLTNQATLTATDGFTNQTITDSQPIIDTDLANDLGAENKGEVIKSTSTNNNININTNQNSNTNSGTNTNSQ